MYISRLLLGFAALALFAACSAPAASPSPSSSPSPSALATSSVRPILVSSEVVKGPNRLLFSLVDASNRLIAAPDVPVHLRFYEVSADPDEVAFEADGRFLWAVEGAQGLYVAAVDFPRAGTWQTEFEVGLAGGSTVVRAEYPVAESGTSPSVGAPAPSVDTPTADQVGGDLAQVSTDSDPVGRFYETSIADAISANEPFVVVFATPAFCETRLCGPTLDTVKSVASSNPELTFINVEPYRMTFTDGRLQPELDANGQLQPAPWTTTWGLPSEPYTFVIAADGTVAAKLEGVLAADELQDAIDAL